MTDFIYPPLCLHCQEITENTLLCKHCQELMSILPINETHIAAVFEYQGPAVSLIHQFKYSNRPHLAKDLAAFMIVQLDRLGWPMPDLIVPVPQSFLRYLKRGYNQSALLAIEIGNLLEKPSKDLLKKENTGFSQMGQDKSQRMQLPEEAFSWNKLLPIENKTILLVDDVMTTGTTLKHCTTRLQEGNPKAIYALTFCMA